MGSENYLTRVNKNLAMHLADFERSNLLNEFDDFIE